MIGIRAISITVQKNPVYMNMKPAIGGPIAAVNPLAICFIEMYSILFFGKWIEIIELVVWFATAVPTPYVRRKINARIKNL